MSDVLDNVETCKACALKHLSDALVWLEDKDAQQAVRAAYISGNLSHASGHLLKLSEPLANDCREIRLDLFNNSFEQTTDTNAAMGRIKALIERVAEFSASGYAEYKEVKYDTVVMRPVKSTPKKGGCGCRK